MLHDVEASLCHKFLDVLFVIFKPSNKISATKQNWKLTCISHTREYSGNKAVNYGHMKFYRQFSHSLACMIMDEFTV